MSDHPELFYPEVVRLFLGRKDDPDESIIQQAGEAVRDSAFTLHNGRHDFLYLAKRGSPHLPFTAANLVWYINTMIWIAEWVERYPARGEDGRILDAGIIREMASALPINNADTDMVDGLLDLLSTPPLRQAAVGAFVNMRVADPNAKARVVAAVSELLLPGRGFGVPRMTAIETLLAMGRPFPIPPGGQKEEQESKVVLDQTAVDRIALCLDDDEAEVRETAIRALEKVDFEKIMPVLPPRPGEDHHQTLEGGMLPPKNDWTSQKYFVTIITKIATHLTDVEVCMMTALEALAELATTYAHWMRNHFLDSPQTIKEVIDWILALLRRPRSDVEHEFHDVLYVRSAAVKALLPIAKPVLTATARGIAEREREGERSRARALAPRRTEPSPADRVTGAVFAALPQLIAASDEDVTLGALAIKVLKELSNYLASEHEAHLVLASEQSP